MEGGGLLLAEAPQCYPSPNVIWRATKPFGAGVRAAVMDEEGLKAIMMPPMPLLVLQFVDDDALLDSSVA